MRNRYLDLLRFLAIVRVVVYHVTGSAMMTIAFPAMSVMFALAGSMMAASIDRSGVSAIGRRLRRLLPSLWVLAAVFVPAMLLTGLAFNWKLLLWVVPLTDPPAAPTTGDWGAISLSVVWYLRDFLWFVLVSPLALRLFRRAPLPVLLTPYVFLLVLEFGGVVAHPVVRDFGLYFGAWMLGFAHHDGLLQRLSRRLLLTLVTVLGVTGLAWAFTHQGARSYDLNDIPLANALWSAAFILVVLGFAPAGAAWVDRNPLFGRIVTIFNRRALTIYLWHMPFVALVTPLVDIAGWTHEDPVGRAVRVCLVFGLVCIPVALFGWIEDIAARRRPELVPGGPVRVPADSPAPPADREPEAAEDNGARRVNAGRS